MAHLGVLCRSSRITFGLSSQVLGSLPKGQACVKICLLFDSDLCLAGCRAASGRASTRTTRLWQDSLGKCHCKRVQRPFLADLRS